MNDLTEKWKKGKLSKGEEYWVILTGEWYLQNPVKPVRAFYSCDCEFEGYLDDDIKEVLAPVPSYEEWQALNGNMDSVIQTNRALCKKLTQLKELLKECKEPIEVLAEKRDACDWYHEDVLAKLYQVLGEDK